MRKWGKRLFAGALVAALTATSVMNVFAEETSTIDLADGLTAYYSFDNTLENDVTGNEATITTGAGDSWGTTSTSDNAVYEAGHNGTAFSFAGNTAVEGVITDAVNSGDGLILDVQTADSFTISGWVCTAQKLNYQPVYFVASSFDDYLNLGTIFNDCWGGVLTMVGGWGGTVLWVDCYDPDITIDTWQYLTATVSSDGTVCYYMNGVLLNSNSFGSAYTGQFSGVDICLGINYWNASFAGLMDDITVYSRALSADEVAALYAEDGVPHDVTQTTDSIAMAVDDTRELSSYVKTIPATLDTSYTYTITQDDEYISVSDGTITALKKGTATLTVVYTVDEDTYTLTYTIEVSEPNSIEAVSLGVESVDLVVGGTMQLAANYTAEKNTTITDEYTTAFASDNTAVVTVDATTGLVTAVGAGTANVTVTVTGTDHDGVAYTYTASVKITVTEPETVAATEPESETETETEAETTTAAIATNNDADPTATTTAKTSENTSDTFAWSYVILLAGAAAAVVVIARKKVTE